MSVSRKMKKLVSATLSKYSISSVDEAGIKTMIAGEGYTVIRFSAISSNEQTARLLNALYLDERAEFQDSFTYNDRERRIVFIRKDISDDEFVYLLALELGRILTFRTECDGVIGISSAEDRDAHEFAHHMCDIAEHGIIYNFFKSYTVQSIASSVFAIVCISLLICFFTVKVLFSGAEVIDDTIGVSDVSSIVSDISMNNSDAVVGIISGMDNLNITQDSDIVSDASTDSTEVTHASENETVKPVEAENQSASGFYSTKSGKKYHTAGCGYISGKEVKAVLVSEIDSGAYTPCSRCIA